MISVAQPSTFKWHFHFSSSFINISIFHTHARLFWVTTTHLHCPTPLGHQIPISIDSPVPPLHCPSTPTGPLPHHPWGNVGIKFFMHECTQVAHITHFLLDSYLLILSPVDYLGISVHPRLGSH